MVQTMAKTSARRLLGSGHAYARREPEKRALYEVFHRYLPSFECMWVDSDTSNCLPKHVTQELHQFLTCVISAMCYGFSPTRYLLGLAATTPAAIPVRSLSFNAPRPTCASTQVAPKPTQADIDFAVERTRERILKYRQKRGVITFAAAPGDDEVNAILGEGFGETNPAHSTLLSAGISGSPPAGPAHKRKPVLMLSEAEMSPEHKGYLCPRCI